MMITVGELEDLCLERITPDHNRPRVVQKKVLSIGANSVDYAVVVQFCDNTAFRFEYSLPTHTTEFCVGRLVCRRTVTVDEWLDE